MIGYNWRKSVLNSGLKENERGEGETIRTCVTFRAHTFLIYTNLRTADQRFKKFDTRCIRNSNIRKKGRREAFRIYLLYI